MPPAGCTACAAGLVPSGLAASGAGRRRRACGTWCGLASPGLRRVELVGDPGLAVRGAGLLPPAGCTACVAGLVPSGFAARSGWRPRACGRWCGALVPAGCTAHEARLVPWGLAARGAASRRLRACGTWCGLTSPGLRHVELVSDPGLRHGGLVPAGLAARAASWRLRLAARGAGLVPAGPAARGAGPVLFGPAARGARWCLPGPRYVVPSRSLAGARRVVPGRRDGNGSDGVVRRHRRPPPRHGTSRRPVHHPPGPTPPMRGRPVRTAHSRPHRLVVRSDRCRQVRHALAQPAVHRRRGRPSLRDRPYDQ